MELFTLVNNDGILKIYNKEVAVISFCYLQTKSTYLANKHPSWGKIKNLSSDNTDTTIIGGVQLQHHRAELLGRVELLGTGQDSAGLTGAWRPVE